MWSSSLHANFAVARSAIRAHPREAYVDWLRRFEDTAQANQTWPVGSGRLRGRKTYVYSQTVGASFMERSWTLIFGCAKPHPDTARCLFRRNESLFDMRLRCNHGFRGISNASRYESSMGRRKPNSNGLNTLKQGFYETHVLAGLVEAQAEEDSNGMAAYAYGCHHWHDLSRALKRTIHSSVL